MAVRLESRNKQALWSALKCPHCNGLPILTRVHNDNPVAAWDPRFKDSWFCVKCQNCQHSTPVLPKSEEAIDHWQLVAKMCGSQPDAEDTPFS